MSRLHFESGPNGQDSHNRIIKETGSSDNSCSYFLHSFFFNGFLLFFLFEVNFRGTSDTSATSTCVDGTDIPVYFYFVVLL